MALPPQETCQECGKTISGRAHAHVWQGQKIVCTSCRNKLAAREQSAGDWKQFMDGPPPASEIEYADGLGVFPSPGISNRELRAWISRQKDSDEQSPPWPLQLARQLGLTVTNYDGLRSVYRDIHHLLKTRADRTALAEWFVYHVARELRGGGAGDPRLRGVPPDVARAVAAQMATEPKVMASIERYDGDALLDFGLTTDGEGWERVGGSKRARAFKRAAELLRAAGY